MRAYTIIAVLLAMTALTKLPAAAQQVGTATAVNPLTESTPPGAATEPLTVGARIIHKERIHTDADRDGSARFPRQEHAQHRAQYQHRDQ